MYSVVEGQFLYLLKVYLLLPWGCLVATLELESCIGLSSKITILSISPTTTHQGSGIKKEVVEVASG